MARWKRINPNVEATLCDACGTAMADWWDQDNDRDLCTACREAEE